MNADKNIQMRLYLSTPAQDDMDSFLRSVTLSKSLHAPWVTPPNNEEQYQSYINRTNKDNQYGSFLRLRDTNDIVGVININEIVRGCFQSGYLGFYLFDGYQNRGLMTEGIRLVIRQAFNTLGLHRLEANIQPANIKSISVINRLGFRHEGSSPRYLLVNEGWQDHERFALTKEDI